MKTIMAQVDAGDREIKILRVSDQEARIRVTQGESVYIPKSEFKKAHPEKKGPAETKGRR